MNGAGGLPNQQCGFGSLKLVVEQNLAGLVVSPRNRMSPTADRKKSHEA